MSRALSWTGETDPLCASLFWRVLLSAPCLLVASTALAQAQPSAGERVLAETLFREGRALLEDDKVPEACAKLAESNRLEPRLGTLLNLAICHEREGKTASAWAEYTDAATQAYQVGHAARERFATSKARELEGSLSQIIVSIEAPLDGLELRLDGQILGRPVWGMPLPVDPGQHRLVASARSYRSWAFDFSIAPGAEKRVLPIPALEPEPITEPDSAPITTATPASPAPPPSVPPPATPTPSTAHRIATFTTLGAGAALVVTGSVFGVRAFSKHASANEECDATTCTSAGLQLDAEARTAATVSTAAFALGLTGVGVGVYLLLTGQTPAATQTSALPLLSPNLAGAALRGSF